MWICGGDPVGNSDCGSGLWPGLFFSGLYRRETLGLEKLLANGISALHHHNGAFLFPLGFVNNQLCPVLQGREVGS